jgi:hypothetical protein
MFQQFFLTDDSAAVLHQVLQDGKLLDRKNSFLIFIISLDGIRVDYEVPVSEYDISLSALAPENGAYSGQQFRKMKWFYQVVIGSCFQSPGAVFYSERAVSISMPTGESAALSLLQTSIPSTLGSMMSRIISRSCSVPLCRGFLPVVSGVAGITLLV